MKTLIVPMMESIVKSSNIRPSWMWTHPFGKFAGVESIRGLNLSNFTHVFFVTHEMYESQYGFVESFVEEVQKLYPRLTVEVVLLSKITHSQAETVYECIRQKYIDGPILVKDVDNYFEFTDNRDDNYVCYYDLNSGSQTNIRNKSYLQFESNGLLSNIVEQKVISPYFSTGGYGFESAKQFADHFEELSVHIKNIYLSNIIFNMLLRDIKFHGTKITTYEDWGTVEDWNQYKSTFTTIFTDLDGTLIENRASNMNPRIGTGYPLTQNIAHLRKLYDRGRTHIVVTTARPEKYRRLTENELRRHQIPYDSLIMGLPHSRRMIINDFAESNVYPSCFAVNIPRNSDKLAEYIP